MSTDHPTVTTGPAAEPSADAGGSRIDPVARSRKIQRRTGPTFHLATLLLPRRVRHATYVLYAYFRIADEVVDRDTALPPAVQRERLEAIRDAALGRVQEGDPVLAAFSDVRTAYGIPDGTVETFIDAMLADVGTDRYPTYADLEGYMAGSAAAVGEMMTRIMEPDDPEAALPHARALGEAFQLTNFARDVREDAVERGRVYLPTETLAAHGATPEQVLRLVDSPGIRAAVRTEVRRAEDRYRDGVAGIRHLPADCRFAVLLAAVLYAEHHRLIRRRGYDTLGATPSLSMPRKLLAVARTAWHWWRTRDPVTTFARASAVPAADDRDARPFGTAHPTP